MLQETKKHKELLEIYKFHEDCRNALKEKTFDDLLLDEKYRAYKSIQDRGKEKPCQYCMYCDKIKEKCINNLKIRKKMEACYNARNIYLLQKAGLYGTKRKP